jgi:hypothetical protein
MALLEEEDLLLLTPGSINDYDHASYLPPDAFVIPDPYEVFLNSSAQEEPVALLTIACDMEGLHAVSVLVANTEAVDAIIDPGLQIIAMSETTCHNLCLTYDPRVRLNMQSANGEVNKSLGLARNVPCRIRDIVLYLQIHIIWNAAYDFLLGRPFDVLTCSVVKNFANRFQTLTINYPNTGGVATIPTMERRPPRHKRVDAL